MCSGEPPETHPNGCARPDDITYGAGCRNGSRSVGLRARQHRDSGPGPETLQVTVSGLSDAGCWVDSLHPPRSSFPNLIELLQRFAIVLQISAARGYRWILHVWLVNM